MARNLTRAERLQVASLAGLAARFTGGFGEQTTRNALLLQGDLENGDDPRGAVAAAIGVLHAVSDDPAVLTEAAAMYCPDGNGYFYGQAALKLFALAGADIAEAERVMAARGQGWRTPQADPALRRSGS